MTLTVTPAELRKDLDALIEKVEHGDELHVVSRRPSPASVAAAFGIDRGRIKVIGPIEGPIIPEEDWHCLRDDVSNGL